MPGLEQPQTTAAAHSAPSGFHAELNNIWSPQKQLADAANAAGQFMVGMGDGFGAFLTESAQAAGNAITHPVETVSNAVEGTKTVVAGTVGAMEAGASYVADKVSHGDIAGMANDAIHTGEAVGGRIGQAVDHWNHLSAHDKGFVVGHDVAPTVIATVVLPEVMPEIDLAAGAGKVMEVAGTIAKESGAVVKVAETFDGTITKMATVGDKIAALSKKMEAFTHGENNLVRAAEAMGDRVRDKTGEIVRGIEPSPEFIKKVEEAKERLTAFESSMLKSATFKTAHNMAEQLGKDHVFALGTWVRNENTVRIAEYTGFAGDLEPNHDIFHSLSHEIGHLVSDKLGRFEPLSAGRGFLDLIDSEIQNGSPQTKQVGQYLLAKFKDAEGRSHEIFADGWAHAADQELGLESTNSYARMIRDAFPKTLEWIRDYRKSQI